MYIFKQLKKSKKIFILILFIMLLIIVFSSMHISLFSDEGFTLGLIKNNYYNLIKLDSLDVHPPLYYILLKMFLSLTTFWSNNIIIKIIFARLFSLIISLISFIILHKILKQLRIQNNLMIESIIFMFLGFVPFAFVPISNFLIIRMYPLAALFIILQFFEIINFEKTNNNKYLFLILLLSLSAFYTHYISAIISGSLLLVLFFKYLLLKDKRYLKILFIGIVVIICYIPWMIIAFNQAISLSNGNWWMDYKYFFINIIIVLLFILLFYIPIFLCRNEIINFTKSKINYLNISIFLFLLIVLLISILGNPMFQAKYMYPILLLYLFISINILVKNCEQMKILFIIILFVLLLGNSYNTAQQVVHYDLSNFTIIREIKSIKHISNVQINNYNNNNLSSQAKYYTIILYCRYANKHVENYEILLNPNNKLTNNYYTLYKNVYFGGNKYK